MASGSAIWRANIVLARCGRGDLLEYIAFYAVVAYD